VTDPEVLGREAEQSDALDLAVSIGLVAYGTVHLLIGWLAIQLALGDHSQQANAQGAITQGLWLWVFTPGLVLAILITGMSFINFGVDLLSNPHLREDA